MSRPVVVPIGAALQIRAARRRTRDELRAELGQELVAVRAGDLARLTQVVRLCRRLGYQPESIIRLGGLPDGR